MMLKQRLNYFTPSQLQPSGAGLLGTTQRVEIDRTWPIEEILVIVNCTQDGTARVVKVPDGVLGVLKKATLSINDGVQPRNVVDFTGVGLLEYAQLVGLNADTPTLAISAINADSVADNTNYKVAANLKYQICYRIPLVHPLIAEPLRTRMLLPVHTYDQNPILTLEFETAGNILGAGTLAACTAEIVLVRRDMPTGFSDQIVKAGGFIPFDLVETPIAVPLSTAAEQRFSVPTPGSYMNLLFRHYLGGSTVTRAPIDSPTFGSEGRWRLETGGSVIREWRWKHLQIINDFSNARQAQRTANVDASPAQYAKITDFLGGLPGSVAANTSFKPAAACLLEFLSDGLDSANELGSVLDANLPTQSGLKVEVIGTPASVGTNASVLYIGGHRLFGDLSKWQAVRA
jgi:hypothetical protein